MNQEERCVPVPLRIEMATGEIEGGDCLAWADPEQMIASLASCTPADTFARHVEPRLADLDHVAGGHADGRSDRLPPRVLGLIERLRQIHTRLYRENRSLSFEPRRIRLVTAILDESRVYLVKAGPCWVYRVRGGAASDACGFLSTGEAATQPGLGEDERLSLTVTSLDVEPGDLIAILMGGRGAPPEPRVVASTFCGSGDIRRACHGLMNLLSLQTDSGCIVGMRFVPISASAAAGEPASSFGILAEELADILGGGDAPPRPPGTEATGPGGEGLGFRFPWEEPEPRGGACEPIREPEPAQEPPGPVKPPPRQRNRGMSAGIWFASFGIVIALLVTVIAVPRGVRMFQGGMFGGGGGTLEVDVTPPARAIFIDGVEQRSGSPTVLEDVAPGLRTIRADLGVHGSVERSVRIRAGQRTRLHLRALGSIDLTAAETRANAWAWVRGSGRVPVPGRIDSLPVGTVDLFYEDPQVPLWQRQVVVRAGEPRRVRVPNAISPGRSHIRIESWREAQGVALEESHGDSVFVDRAFVGTTPWEGEVAPGFHGIRVSAGGGRSWTEVVTMSAGGSRLVAPRFGDEGWPRFRHLEPGRVVLRGPLLLTVTIENPSGEPVRNPRFHLPELASGVRDVPLSLVDPEGRVFVGMMESAGVPHDRPILYYFTVQTAGGAVVCSDLYRLTLVDHLSQRIEP